MMYLLVLQCFLTYICSGADSIIIAVILEEKVRVFRTIYNGH